MDKVIGIDLGTTFSAVAHIDEESGRAEVLTDPETQERITPSVILFESQDNVIVGKMAKDNAVSEANRVVEFVKREMGKEIGEPPVGWCFDLEGRKYGAQELSGLILKKVKQDAESRLGREVTKAVITCPAYFGEPQRAATIEAGKIAGLEVLGILDEPVAAALAYGLDRLDKDQTVFVFDLGGGTFDLSIVQIEDKTLKEVAIGGDNWLGGKDWDDRIIEWVSKKFREAHGIDPQKDLASYQDIQLRAIRAKTELSRRHQTRIVAHHEGKSLTLELTRDKFENMTADLIARCRNCCEDVLSEAGKRWEDIDTVLLVGGSTRMPMIRRLVKEISGKEATMDVNPDECVAQGAAWHALLLSTGKGEGVVEDLTRVNPALGSKLADVSVQKITAREFGATGLDGDDVRRSFIVITKFSRCPAEGIRQFGTRYANQRRVEIDVTEGGLYYSEETCDPESCEILGKVVLSNLPPLPKGSPIQVMYRFNTDGVLEVEAQSLESGQKVTARIDHKGALSDQELERAVQAMKSTEVRG